jgi:DNA-binding Lrp family transcriptional regulator
MELPANIKAALKKIQSQRKHYVEVKLINGRCYVYESTSRWDGAAGKVRKSSKYIGKITGDGRFVAARPRTPGSEAARVAAATRQERFAIGAGRQAAQSPGRSLEGDEIDRRMLGLLSMSGRAGIPEIAEDMGIGEGSAEWRKRRIEKRYGIRYIAEIDVGKLGYLTYIIFIKFEGRKPGIRDAARELEKEPSVQLAMMTYGRYDIIMYMVISKYDDIKAHLFGFRSRIFPGMDRKLYVVPIYLDYSFVPLRPVFLDELKKKVWTRSAQKPKPAEGELLAREYAVIRSLGIDGRQDFSRIDREYGLQPGSARYTYHRLLDRGMVQRITVSMQNIHVSYISAMLLQKINHNKFAACREMLLRHIIDDRPGSVTNRYALVGDIKVPEGVFFLMPVRDDRDMLDADEALGKIGGAEADSSIVTNIIVGSLCYRRFDNSQSSQYRIIENEYSGASR